MQRFQRGFTYRPDNREIKQEVGEAIEVIRNDLLDLGFRRF